MSPLSADRLLIGLAPEAVTLLRVSGGARPRVLDQRTLACDPADAEPWQGPAATLSRLLADSVKARARATVVLSNHFARYALVPWSEGLRKTEEDAAYARYCFAKIHGERSKDWELRLSPGPSGAERVASAVDAPLLQALRSAFPAKSTLVSVQPYLMSAFNRFRRQLAGARAWLLLVEPRRTCLARLEKGRWVSVRNSRAEAHGPERWADLLDRERHLAGGEPADEDVLVHGAEDWKADSAKVAGWTFGRLAPAAAQGLDPAASQSYALALCAL